MKYYTFKLSWTDAVIKEMLTTGIDSIEDCEFFISTRLFTSRERAEAEAKQMITDSINDRISREDCDSDEEYEAGVQSYRDEITYKIFEFELENN